MKVDDILTELESVCEKKGIRVTYEAIGGELGAGGLCRLRGEHRCIVDKRATAGEKATVLSQALAQFDLEDVFITEETRRRIDRFRQSAAPSPA